MVALEKMKSASSLYYAEKSVAITMKRNVWHIRMRQGKGSTQQDYSQDGYNRKYVGMACNSCAKSFDPRRASDEELQEIESNEKDRWSKKQGSIITQFIRDIRINDVVLLAKQRGSGLLSVGLITSSSFFRHGETLPLRRSVKWIVPSTTGIIC